MFYTLLCVRCLSLLLCHVMWLMCDQVMSSLTLTLSSKNRKIENRLRRKENKSEREKHWSLPSAILTYLSKFVTFSYYFSILLRRHSASISFLWITLFISLLNSLINNLPLKSLPLTIHLNFYTNSFIVFNSFSIFFNSIIFINLLFLFSNSYFRLIKKFFHHYKLQTSIFQILHYILLPNIC